MELTGIITSLKKDFGFIRAHTALPDPYTNKEIYFRFNNIRKNASPSVHDQVKFELNKGKPERPSVKYLIIVDTSNEGVDTTDDANEVSVQDEFTKYVKGIEFPGVVITVKDQFGFIQLDGELPGPFPRKNVYFRLARVKNKNAVVEEGHVVICEVNERSKPDRPSAKRVTIKLPGETMEPEPEIEKPKRSTHVKDFYTGIVVTIKQQSGQGKGIGFIKPSEELPIPYPEDKDVFFHLNSVQSGNLDLEEGDEVEFSLGTKDKRRPFGFRVKLIKCNPQITYSERMENYLRQSLDRIVDENGCRSEHILSLLSCTSVWQKIGEEKDLSTNCISVLINLIEQLEKQSRGLEENFKNVLRILTTTPLFCHRNGRFKKFVEETINSGYGDSVDLIDIQNILLLIMQYVPEKIRAIVGIIKPVVSKSSKELFLYDVLKLLCRSLNELCVEDMEWNELPLVPSVHEILYGAVKDNTNMRSVKKTGRYSSVEEYMDTYFRLLRADCFDALIEGIKALLTGTLDERDMFVYQNIELVGVVITQNENGITLGMKVTPQIDVQNWDTSPNLVFGNLLCISPNGNFKDVIWATVMSRALLKSMGIVLVDLCTECNTMSDPIAIRMIEASGGRGLMAESPTYYRAYHPVLKTLQKLDPQQMSFSDELVAVQPPVWPSAITPNSTYDKAILSSEIKGQDFLFNLLRSDVMNCTLDKSQERAVKQALQNRIAIIQGPPGTGKTFVGIKLLELIVSLQPAVKLPILVLTYKNHALDEFLMAMLKIFPGKIARVGGRSQESGLEGCNVNQLKKDKLSSIHPNLLNDIHQFQAKIEELKPKVENSFKKLEDDKSLTVESLRKNLSNTQIQHMLTGCNWDEVKLPSILYNNKEGQNVSGGVKNKKKCKMKFMNKEEAFKLLEILEMEAEQFVSTCKAAELQNLRQHINKMVVASIKQWIPVKSEFDSLAEASHNIVKLSKKGASDYSGEIDTLKIEEERLAAYATDFESKEEILKNIIMLKQGSSTNWMPALISSVKYILDDLPLGFLANTENLWQLPPKERVLFIQAILFSTFEENAKVLVDLLQDYQRLCKAKSEIENQHRIETLRKMTVVGMTITGASIQHDLLSQLKPEVILVEEAAEVLEPQLVAAIGNWCKHLILIGDHKQLRPQVQSITLERDYSFNVSMMERLINNDLYYATLTMQNRMRPEFAEMLHDIYPQLKSNYDRVLRNKVPSCISSSMFFWNHNTEETKHHHTFTNQEEADRAIKLALFFIQQGYNPSQVTILGAYLRQVRLIRVCMSKAQRDHPSIMDLHRQTTDKKGDKLGKVKIQTIDNYQGDENDIVIVSLVRSNGKGIGFLKEINRRCVAQSRARCGMYFIGNRNTFSQPPWEKLLDYMDDRGLVGDKMELQCPRHDIYSKFTVGCAADITLGCICNMNCGKLMDCKRHLCVEKCQPNHKHMKCNEKVSFHFKTCGHPGIRKCSEKESDILCKTSIEHKFAACGHTGKKICKQRDEEVRCTEKCTKLLPCNHKCENLCSMPCTADTCKICKLLRDIEQDRRRRRDEIKRQKVMQDISEEIEKLRKAPIGVEVFELEQDGTTASEYYDIEDKVRKYVKADHKWFPIVTKIQKVSNKKLKLKWMEKKKEMFDPSYTPLKFHGTDKEAMDSIVKTGFRMPKAKGQMYGPGIYFATDSSKSAQDIYTKGSNTLMLCSVLLGKPLTVNSAQTDMTEKYLKDHGYDSLYAKRETKSSGGVLHDEYVVYDPDAALPEYIIHYVKNTDDQILKVLEPLELQALAGQSLVRHTIKPKRTMNSGDPLDVHFRIAESQFLRLTQSAKYKTDAHVKEVEYCLNPNLMKAFSKKRSEYCTKYHGKEKDYILAFHGTKPQFIDGILKNNFDLSKLSVNSGDNGWYGAGIYFSEFPDVSLGYGQSLLLCKVLPGKTYDVPSRMDGKGLQPDYDSHRFHKDSDGRGEEIVIFDPCQILPCYIIKL